MKKLSTILLICGFLGLANTTYGQQTPLFNQYFTQPSLSYSSASVLSQRPQLSLMYRGQWSGLEGAPEVFAMSFSNPLKNKLGYNINLNSFELGFLKQTYIGAGFSKALNLNTHQFSLGAEMGMSLFSLNESRISVESLNDELIQNLFGSKGSAVNLNLSLSYRYKSLNAHFVAINVIEESLSGDGFTQLNSSNQDDFMLGVGYELELNALNQISFTPNVTWRYQDVLGSSFDLAGKLDLKDKFQVNGGYRDNYGATVGVGVKVKPNVLFTYNYDFGKSDVPFVSDGFNEIGLHVTFQNKHEKQSNLENEALAIIERIQKDQIYDRKLIIQEEQEVVVDYLSSQEKGSKKERRVKGDAAFETILSEIEANGFARMQAEANERKEAERLSQLEELRKTQAENDRLVQERADEAKVVTQKQPEKEQKADKGEGNQINGDYILVVSAYSLDNGLAIDHLKALKMSYPEAGIFRSEIRGYDYVYIMAFSDLDKAIESMRALKSESKFPDSWVHILRLSLKK